MSPRLFGNGGACHPVDDDVIPLSLTAELLSGLGCHVTTARDGAEALAVPDHGHALDLLVTGVQMPGVPSVEFARRATAIKPTLAVLYCAGHPELIAEKRGPTLGAIHSKPFPIKELGQKITPVHQAQASSQGNAP